MTTPNHYNSEPSPHKDTVADFITRKTSGYTITWKSGTEIELPESSHIQSQIQQWENKLMEYIRDPEGCEYSALGYGFEFMVSRLLQSQISHLIVLPTPPQLDFVESGSNLPSADLLVGYRNMVGVVPVFLIRATLKEDTVDLIHPLLKVPLVGVVAKECLGGKAGTVMMKFGQMDFDEFCEQTAFAQQIAGNVNKRLHQFGTYTK